MKSFAAVVALASTAAAVLLSAAAANATPPGENGRIAYRLFLNDAETRAAILTIRPNGTHRKWVTHPGRRVLHLSPEWSPSGRWVVFVRAKGKGPDSPNRADHPSLFRIHPNGTGRRDLSFTCTGSCKIDDDPAWSPSGKRIAFTRVWDRGQGEEVDLMVMRADGTKVRHISRHPFGRGADWQPQWSPTGKRLAFMRYNGHRDASAVFTIRLDGTGLRRVTRWYDGFENLFPDWSPNGRWIVFRTEGSGVWLTHPNGEGRHRIAGTSGGTVEWGSGSFSPDGTAIVYSRRPADEPGFDVFRMDVDGSNPVNLTQTASSDGAPDWGPRRR
jgi:Tol biopolymer transport system component